MCSADKKGEIVMAKNKHLTDGERLQIEQWLKERISIKRIASKLDKSTSTISREIRSRTTPSDKSAPHRVPNRCKKRLICKKSFLCEDKQDCTKHCPTCRLCNSLCSDFEEEICTKLLVPPYVCNGCTDEHLCVLKKQYYLHRQAHKAYREKLVESRVGANISEDELLSLDELVSPLVMRGQSIHHIVVNNQDKFEISEKSIYRYVSGGLLKARNIDMPRVCRLKPRKSKPVEHKIDNTCRIGRTYIQFNEYMEQSDGIPAVEMDSVIGHIGGKVLLTLMFKSCDLMLAFIRERNTSQSVIDVFNDVYEKLGTESFRVLFPVILTDNGSEFSNPTALEFDEHGIRRTKLFYCDPCAAFQKPNVELNHEFVRKILPKGRSFDELSQSDINIMMSHINSYSREKLNDKSPFDVFSFLYGHDILEKLGICRIPANEIILKPSLLKI
jgi:IS30 family transposase